jgi:hypothetical protein
MNVLDDDEDRRFKAVVETMMRDLDRTIETLAKMNRGLDELKQIFDDGFKGMREDIQRLSQLDARITKLERDQRQLPSPRASAQIKTQPGWYRRRRRQSS